MKPLMSTSFQHDLQKNLLRNVQHRYQKISVAAYFIAVTCLFSSGSFAADLAEKNQTNKKHSGKSNTVAEISIIGNTELPNVSFNLPWRLPSVANRAEQSPIKFLDNMLVPIEPKRHRKMVFFSEHLELDVPKLNGQQ